MIDSRIILSILWIILMLTYLLGDVLRMYSGDQKKHYNNKQSIKNIWTFTVIFMTIPLIMSFLTLVLPAGINRLINIIAPLSLFVFNMIGLPSYKSFFDRFLIAFGLIINLLTIYYAWNL
jgi:hypothetical protein